MSDATVIEPHVFEYSQLASSIEKMTQQLAEYGFIAIRNVPEFVEKYNRYITESSGFMASGEDVIKSCQPENFFENGWSDGMEIFNGLQDTYKDHTMQISLKQLKMYGLIQRPFLISRKVTWILDS
jgi:hypothetical protein